ncbi:uncharacterized protein [Medicago truncatula]|uniref:uncharacterized protein n=1 Tax=Medicago truncatula TaxID=3880 RepID=UPI0019671BB7|nr:uncharacterized protein LOC112418143 [Medicago truncatula]
MAGNSRKTDKDIAKHSVLIMYIQRYLNVKVDETFTIINNAAFRFHPRCKRLNLIHVCFADDLLLFSRGDVDSVSQLFEAFSLFSAAFGLKANQVKSSIYLGGVSMSFQDAIVTKFNLIKDELPFRLQLIKSVLFGVQTYWSQVFVLPHKVLKLIQTACRVFVWTGKSGTSKRVLIAWERICLPKTAGGWNVIDLKVWNQTAICKLLWNLANKKDVLWVKWVREYYTKGRNVLLMDVSAQAPWVIKKVFGATKTISSVDGSIFQQANFSIKRMYNALRGDFAKVDEKMETLEEGTEV